MSITEKWLLEVEIRNCSCRLLFDVGSRCIVILLNFQGDLKKEKNVSLSRLPNFFDWELEICYIRPT